MQQVFHLQLNKRKKLYLIVIIENFLFLIKKLRRSMWTPLVFLIDCF